MDIHRWLLIAHVAAGAVALVLFWSAAWMRKGTPKHRRVGQAYLVSMLVVLTTAVPLSLAMLQRGRPDIAAFLGFLALITGTACWSAWRAIRDRRHRERYFGSLYWTMTVVVFVSGLGVVAMGIRMGAALFMVFGAIGIVVLVESIVRYRRAPHDPKWWLREHYTAMIGNGVATHIAFFGIGLRNAFPMLDPAVVQNVAWFGPLAAAVVATVWLERRYGSAKARVRLPQIEPAQS